MAEVVAENLATNPSFEEASGEVVVRENLAINPSAGEPAGGWTPQWGSGGSGDFTTHGSWGDLDQPVVRMEWATAGTAGTRGIDVAFGSGLRAPVTGGAVTPFSIRAASDVRVRISVNWYAAGYLSNVTSSWTDVGYGSPVEVTFSPTAPADATSAEVRLSAESAPAGARLVAGALMVGATGDYFDADSPASGDFTYRERPGGGAQEVAQGAVSVSGGSSAIGFQSQEWADTGTKSFRIRPTGGSAYSYADVNVPQVIYGGLIAGKTYTVAAKARIAVPYRNDTGPRRRVVAFYNVTSGAVETSAPTPNTPGVHDLSLTFTIPASCASGRILFYSGSDDPHDELWVDSIRIHEGTPDEHGYFDGDTQNTATYKYAWTGTPNASTSTKSLVTASDFNLPSGENIRSTLAKYIWFGNQRVQQWLPMPSSGTQASYEYAVGGGGLANGGLHARRSSGFHKTYQFDFAVREADQWNGIEGYNRFASGIDSGIISSGGGTGSGIGEGVLFRFCDPMIMGRNMFTPQWAAPQLCNEFEGEGFHDIAPTRGDTYVTPQNTRHYPATAPYWDLTASDSASVSRQPEDGPRHTFKLLIPPTHVLHLGFVGVVTGAGAIFVEKRFRDGTSGVETITELIDPTSGDGLGSLMVDGSEVAYVTMWLGSTSPGSAAQVALVASTAIELPYWETPDMSTGGWWTEGLGHSGLEFGDGAFVETYEVAVQGGRGRYLKGMSTSLVEVGAWR